MTNIDPKIFKSYDIRATYPEQINEENVYVITQAVYTYLKSLFPQKKSLKIAVGRDMRLSGPSLFPIILKGLTDMGAEVIDVGLLSTPSLYFAVFHYGYDGGIQLSASHNPSNYNGMKIVRNSETGLIKIGKTTGMEDIKNLAVEGKTYFEEIKGTVTQNNNVLKDEIENAKNIFKLSPIKPFKVVADAANAMGAQYLGGLFETMPECNLVKMNFDLDGSFPVHQPDPLVKANSADLRKKVVEEKADIGLAPDGDGDRMFFIDEKGEIVPASIITGIVAREILKDNPGATILFDIRYTMTAKKIITDMGGKYDITKVGHAFITEMMNKTGALFGGESSGHYFFKKTGNAESQIPIVLIILSVMSRENKTLSQLKTELSYSHESGEHNFKTDNAPLILEKLKEKFTDAKLETMDGVAFEYDSWRFGVRSSNTEPLLRLNLEALDEKFMHEKFTEIFEFIKNLGATPIEEH